MNEVLKNTLTTIDDDKQRFIFSQQTNDEGKNGTDDGRYK
jgi:hypothetical protein